MFVIEIIVVPGLGEKAMTGIHLRIAAVDVRLIRINIIIIIIVLMVDVFNLRKRQVFRY